MKKRTILTRIALIIMVICVSACGNPKQKIAEQLAKEINDQKSLISNSQVRIDYAEVLPNFTVKTNSTIFGVDGTDFFMTEEILNETKQMMLSTFKTQPEILKVKDAGISLLYSYADENGIFLYEIAINPEDFD